MTGWEVGLLSNAGMISSVHTIMRRVGMQPD